MEAPVPAPAYLAHAFPVSVKGVAVQGGKVLLLENERNEWELPGGKLELGEDPPDCVVRGISEETGWLVHSRPGAGAGHAGRLSGTLRAAATRWRVPERSDIKQSTEVRFGASYSRTHHGGTGDSIWALRR